MPSPGYSYLTLGAARMQLAERLQDSGLVYYSGGNGAGSPLELNRYIATAIRMWQSFTGSYKQRGVFQTSDNTPFYDLRSVLKDGSGNLLLSQTVTDQDVVNLVLSMLLEPPLTSGWMGSGMFSFAAIMGAIQDRLNSFLSDTEIGISDYQQVAVAPPQDRNFLPDSIVSVKRAAWISSVTEKPTVLWRDDQYSMQSLGQPIGNTPAEPPTVYGTFTMPPVALQVFPPPANNGTLDLLVVLSGLTVGTTPSAVSSSPVALNIPNDFIWAIVYGALAELLANDGPSNDPVRSAYCEQRYQEGVVLAKINPTVMLSQLNGQPIMTDSVFQLDAFLGGWQGTTGTPQYVGMAGRHLAALANVPDGIYGVTMDAVVNMPVPVNDGDYLQADRGSLDPVLDMAQHIASFKMGGAEFLSTEPLRKNFIAAAGVLNSRLRNEAFYKNALLAPSTLQRQEVES